MLSGLVLTVFGVDAAYHNCHNHIINTMAPQPRLQEIWWAEIFEVSDEVHKHWNIIPTRVRHTYSNSWAIEENNRNWEMYEWWMGEVHPADDHRNPEGAFPFTLFRVCVHLCVCLMLCQKNVKYTQLYWQRRYHNLLHHTTRKQQLLCEDVCLCEVERELFGRPYYHTAPL